MREDVLYVIDLDWTLIDLDAAMGLAEEVCIGLGIDFSKVKETQLRASVEMWSYSPLETIEEAGKDKLEQFKKDFIRRAEPDKLIFPDARRYLEKLGEKGRQYMILTYAVSEEWQKIKLAASGLDDIPALIIFNKLKGKEIAAWQNRDGIFEPPITEVKPTKKLIFIDDRLRALQYLPKGCKGYFLNRKAVYDSTIPEGVDKIGKFDEIIDKI